MIISVDFDGTLCKNEFPNIELINMLKKLKSQGNQIILWTCRDKGYLVKAVKWCNKFGLYFNANNDNLQVIKQNFKELSTKVYADIYIDDRNYCFKCDKGVKIK